MPPRKRQLHLANLVVEIENRPTSADILALGYGETVGGTVQPVRHAGRAARKQFARKSVVGVQYGALRPPKEQFFRLAVRFHIPEKIKVITRQVGKYSRLVGDRALFFERERMRRTFHNDGARTATFHIGKQGKQRNGIGRREGGRQNGIAVRGAERADQPDVFALSAQNVAEHMADRRLTVRPRYTDDFQCTFGVSVKGGGNFRHRLASFGNDELRHVEIELVFAHQGVHPAPHRFFGISVRILTRSAVAEKEVALARYAAIANQRVDFPFARDASARFPC